MQKMERKRNTPVVKLIRNFIDKKSGKVSVSRMEIKRRFEGLDWKDQKKVLAAFLDSGVVDREWAYKKLIVYWDKSFEPQVRKLWETYHEPKCAWAVIRYFPLDYIKQHVDEFNEERDYYFISLRMAKDPNYVIDKSKLTKTDYLSLLHHSERTISDEEARDTLYSIVYACCLTENYLIRLEHEGGKDEAITPADFRVVVLAIFYLLKMGKDKVVQQFEEWNQAVEDAIYDSPEFKFIKMDDYFLGYDYDMRRIAVAKIYAYLALDEKYKQPSDPTVEKMREDFFRD